MKKKIFISGPMTGIKDYNYPAFDAAEMALKKAGFKVLNPTIIGKKYGFKREYGFYLSKSLKMLKKSDIVLLLEGWEKSRGARAEAVLASALNKKILCLEEKI